jgi:hypothetical protein
VSETTNISEGEIAQFTDPNAHIRRYLADYLAFPHPIGSAVLLTGAWGSGKTFLVRDLLENQTGQGRSLLLVSLYGLSTRQDIIDALLVAKYPVLADAGRNTSSSFDRVVPYVRPLGPPGADAYVFDDLERASMSIAEVMGFVNLLVERDGRKVLLLANEKSILNEAYKSAKDKVVGRSFTVRPNFESAFDSFIGRIDFAPAAIVLKSVRSELRELFRQSELDNLRVLQQTMWDIERVIHQLLPKHFSNAGAMQALSRLLVALSLELRSGRIEADDLNDRVSKVHSGIFGNEEPSRLRKAAARYPGIRLHDSILPDHVLRDVLSNGIVDGEAIRTALEGSSWFLTHEEPSWRTVWHAFERPDHITEAAAVILVKEFKDRAYEIPGELLHVFGQMLKLAGWGVTEWSLETTYRECRAYIDDLRAQDRLMSPESAVIDQTRFGSYAGLGFDHRHKEEFSELWVYMNEQPDWPSLIATRAWLTSCLVSFATAHPISSS